MSFTLNNPFQYWVFPNKSMAVGGGKLYVGLPDLDPTTPANQVVVKALQQDGSVITLAQPIRLLSGGVPSFNGSPVQLNIDDFIVSLKVDTNSGAQVFYTPRVSMYIDSVRVLMPDGESLSDYSKSIPDWATPEEFGAVGNGLANDTAAMQSALNSGKKRVMGNASKTYAIFAPLLIPDDVILDLAGAEISKQFNGDLFYRVGKRAKVFRGVFLGNGASFSGAGFVVDQGSAASFDDLGLQVFEYCIFKYFRSYSIDYPLGNFGTFSQVKSCFFLPLPVSAGGVGIAIRWPNDFPANNGNRHVVDCYSADTLLTIGSTQNGFIRNNTVGAPDSKSSIVFAGNPLKLIVQGNRFAHGTNLMTVKGTDHVFSSNIMPSEVAFDATCNNVFWDSDNVCLGFSGPVPYSTNSIETNKEIAYLPVWTSDGTQPDYADSDVRGSYSVRGRMVRGQVSITFGAATIFGTGNYFFGLPTIPPTLTKKYSGSAWVQGYPCAALIDPSAAKAAIYQPNGTIVTAINPVALTAGSTILFEFAYEMG